jgi:hypothetical protein
MNILCRSNLAKRGLALELEAAVVVVEEEEPELAQLLRPEAGANNQELGQMSEN